MTFEEFTKLCTVWHLDRFWHIHVNIADDAACHGYMMRVSETVTLPIRWSYLSGKVIWMIGNRIASPYEPAMFMTMNRKSPHIETLWVGFDPNNGLKSSSLNPQSGQYNINWEHNGGNDLPVSITNSDSSACNLTSLVSGIFDPGRAAYRTSTRRTMWSTWSYIQPRYYGSGYRRCSQIFDTDLIEQGTVGTDGTPTIVRWSRLQRHVWKDPDGQQTPIRTNPDDTPEGGVPIDSRMDGPAIVELQGVKTLIQGDLIKTHVMGSEYIHRWIVNGKALDPGKMADVIARNGLIMRDGPLHDHPAFPRSDDLMIWDAAWKNH